MVASEKSAKKEHFCYIKLKLYFLYLNFSIFNKKLLITHLIFYTWRIDNVIDTFRNKVYNKSITYE